MAPTSGNKDRNRGYIFAVTFSRFNLPQYFNLIIIRVTLGRSASTVMWAWQGARRVRELGVEGGRRVRGRLTPVSDELHLYEARIFIVLFKHCVIRHTQLLKNADQMSKMSESSDIILQNSRTPRPC